MRCNQVVPTTSSCLLALGREWYFNFHVLDVPFVVCCFVLFQNLAKAKGKEGQLIKAGEFRYTREAYQMMESCEPTGRYAVKKAVEKYARLQGLKKIHPLDVFMSRPEVRALYPSAARMAFEPHAGPVYSLAPSPFHRNLFLSCSTDNTIRLYNITKVGCS